MNLVWFFAQNEKTKEEKKRSLLKNSPFFRQKLDEDQKKGLHSKLLGFFWVRAKNKGLRLPFVCSKLLPNSQREGGIPQFCILIYANYTIVATQRGAMAQ